MFDHDKWKKAVVHLECATDSVDYVKSVSEIMKKLQSGEKSFDEYAEAIQQVPTRDIRYQGTAFFLEHESRRYLLTARHVVFDQVRAMRELKELTARLGFDQERDYKRAMDAIFQIIFRVLDYNEVATARSVKPNRFLMNLSSGPRSMSRYTFSDPELDLAIISLDSRDNQFADELYQCGKHPISLDDISKGPGLEGEEILAIGYPNTSIIQKLSLEKARHHWSSNDVSLPVSTYGRVSMLHDGLDYFWSDLSIYPGNSGGPVISRDTGKLVGIVSAQATIESEVTGHCDGKEVTGHTNMRIPIANIIKSKNIDAILREQIEKDKL
jgi:S1-C subfamily serine protease